MAGGAGECHGWVTQVAARNMPAEAWTYMVDLQALPTKTTAARCQECVRFRRRRVTVASSARMSVARPSLPMLARTSKPVERCDVLYAAGTDSECFVRHVEPVVMVRVDRAWRPNKDGIDSEI